MNSSSMLKFVVTLLVMLLWSSPSHGMDRPQQRVVKALALAGVKSKPKRKMLATIIRQAAKKHNFDPITMVALLEGESHFKTNLVNSIGCVGIGQVCLKWVFPECNKSKTQFNEAKCAGRRAQMMDPGVNIRFVANSFSVNRRFCNKLTNKRGKSRNLWRHWLPSHGGYNKGNLARKTGVWCGQKWVCSHKKRCRWVNAPIPKRVQLYMNRRKDLIRRSRK